MSRTPKGLLERYLDGEHVQVWSELNALGDEVRSGEHLEPARAVARETMRRVKTDIDTLRERWRARGFRFGYAWAGKRARVEVERAPPLAGPPLSGAVLDAFEHEQGVLPMSLRAFYELIGSVNFVGVGPPGDARWPDREQMDPLQLAPLHLAADPEDTLLLFPDPLLKFFLGGVGPISTPLPSPTADAELWFEGEPLMEGGEAWRLVSYLRETLLERGGMGRPGGAELDKGLVGELTEGLTRF
jgi:hypothetical protein